MRADIGLGPFIGAAAFAGVISGRQAAVKIWKLRRISLYRVCHRVAGGRYHLVDQADPSRCDRTLAPSYVNYAEGFGDFVTPMTAPVAFPLDRSTGRTCTRWKAPPCSQRTREADIADCAVYVAIGRTADFATRSNQGPESAPKRALGELRDA
jgi:hypothetical protein